jgi:hypothetical protein
MRKLSQRQKLLGGVFGIVAGVWGIDRLTGGPGPSAADAAPSPVVVGGPVAMPPDPPDLEAVIESLRSDRAGDLAPLLGWGERDLFVPTRSMEAALRPPDSASIGAAADACEEEAAKSLPFDGRHVLQGVLTGRTPLALIDGELYRCGAEVEGYRLIEIRRDYVVFVGEGSRVTLRVAGAEH